MLSKVIKEKKNFNSNLSNKPKQAQISDSAHKKNPPHDFIKTTLIMPIKKVIILIQIA